MRLVKRVFQWLVILLMTALFIRGVMYIFNGSGTHALKGKEYVAVITFSGVIEGSDRLITQFSELEKKDNIKGYLLRVNSPGGLVVPSQEIYEYLRTLKKPLYVAMSSSAASGGYMISLAAKKIYAMPSTVTGSIGVIMQIPNYAQLMDKIGVSFKVLKSGEFKDTGSSSREMTERDEAYLNGIVMDMYEQFVSAVSVSRELDIDVAKALADGKIYTGRAALELGLVDNLGTWREALDALKTELGNADMEHYEVNDELNPWKKYFSEIPGLLGLKTDYPKILPSGFYYYQEF